MGKVFTLDHEEARMIADIIIELVNELELSGSIWIKNRFGALLTADVVGDANPLTQHIADLKAGQAAYTGTDTEVVGNNIKQGERTKGLYGLEQDTLVPFAGGVPIYHVETGILLGSVGFSQLSAESDRDIIHAAIDMIEDVTYKKPALVVIEKKDLQNAVKTITDQRRKIS